MTFTKTSQKFGQWSDVRANTIYGLGFSSEVELGKVCEMYLNLMYIYYILYIYYIYININNIIYLAVYREISRSEGGH